MTTRSFGWIQNPSDFNKLKMIVQIFDSSSDHYKKLKNSLVKNFIHFPEIKETLLNKLNEGTTVFTYGDLVGTSRDLNRKPAKKRQDAVADSLIQITIRNQKGRAWTDNWTADGFLRWAVTFGFVSYNRENDTFEITESGLDFSRSHQEPEKDPIFHEAIITYPPASQVLKILDKARVNDELHKDNSLDPGWRNKFFIGNELGFKGEPGFTSYPNDLMLSMLQDSTSPKEATKIRSDREGSADKYARMIATWLKKIGYLESRQGSKIEILNSTQVSGFPEYRITASGIYAYRKSLGQSKNPKLPKRVDWEYLALKGSNRDYNRTRRAHILTFLEKGSSRSAMLAYLKDLGFSDDSRIIDIDLLGLQKIGINLRIDNNSIKLEDTIVGLSIPETPYTKALHKSLHEDKKNQIISKTNLPAKYYELFDLAYDNKRNRDFEILTMDFMKSIFGFTAKHLGGSNKPDGIAYSDPSGFGLIVDTKAYSSGYSKSISEEDKMVRYVEEFQEKSASRNPNEWWLDFPASINDNRVYFLWTSSLYKGNFLKQIESTANRTSSRGAAINIENLLLIGNEIYNSRMTLDEFEDLIRNNEITF